MHNSKIDLFHNKIPLFAFLMIRSVRKLRSNFLTLLIIIAEGALRVFGRQQADQLLGNLTIQELFDSWKELVRAFLPVVTTILKEDKLGFSIRQ